MASKESPIYDKPKLPPSPSPLVSSPSAPSLVSSAPCFALSGLPHVLTSHPPRKRPDETVTLGDMHREFEAGTHLYAAHPAIPCALHQTLLVHLAPHDAKPYGVHQILCWSPWLGLGFMAYAYA